MQEKNKRKNNRNPKTKEKKQWEFHRRGHTNVKF